MKIRNICCIENDTGSVTPNHNIWGITDKLSKGKTRMWEDVKKDKTTVRQISDKGDSQIA